MHCLEMAPVRLACSFACTRARAGRPVVSPVRPGGGAARLDPWTAARSTLRPLLPAAPLPPPRFALSSSGRKFAGRRGLWSLLAQATVSPDPFAAVRPSAGDTPRLAGPWGFSSVWLFSWQFKSSRFVRAAFALRGARRCCRGFLPVDAAAGHPAVAAIAGHDAGR